MNDCIWNYCDVCNIMRCENCPYYKSMNSDEGEQMMNDFHEEIMEATKEVKNKWRKIMVEVMEKRK